MFYDKFLMNIYIKQTCVYTFLCDVIEIHISASYLLGVTSLFFSTNRGGLIDLVNRAVVFLFRGEIIEELAWLKSSNAYLRYLRASSQECIKRAWKFMQRSCDKLRSIRTRVYHCTSHISNKHALTSAIFTDKQTADHQHSCYKFMHTLCRMHLCILHKIACVRGL